MFGLPAIGFATPAVLFGLALLPVIWWLLRLTPPRPETEVFPPMRILLSLIKREETPVKSPWWLTLLRLLMAALVIFALARPLMNPQDRIQLADGPLLILVDNSWAAATGWDARQRTAQGLISRAADLSRPVAVAATVAPENAEVTLADAATALESFNALAPVAAPPQRAAALAKLVAAAEGQPGATLAVFSDGIAAEGDDTLQDALGDVDLASLLVYRGDTNGLEAIASAANRADGFEATVVRTLASAPDDATAISAYDQRNRLLAQGSAVFETAADSALVTLDVPFELRNDMAALRIDGQANAGAVHLLDENAKRRRFALLSGFAGDEAQPLLSPLYYIDRAIAPWADIIRPRSGDLTTDLPALIDQGPAVIVMADIGVLPDAVLPAVEQWIENGGTLVRFAGPRMAGSVNDDTLLPVRLRAGERALGGSLTWTEPQPVAAFPENGPFSGLEAPREISVTRQILAEPETDLATKTWASLADGTPLVTGTRRGDGTIVLFHVTAEATWSNLPISGTFVDMLRKIADLSTNTGAVAATTASGATQAALPPLRILRGDGELIAPPAHVRPLQPQESLAPSYDNPAGLYGTPDAFVAINVLKEGDTLAPFAFDAPLAAQDMAYAEARESDLSGWLYAIAMALLALDTLAMLWLGGKLKKARRPAPSAAALMLAIAGLAAIIAVQPAVAQESFNDYKSGDEELLDQLETTNIGFVLTGNRGVDEVTRSGISGISRFLASRTAFEPGEPVGLDIEVDELSFYPLIYFPVVADAPMPSPEAIARLDAYMQNGGTVLFDTRDQLGAELASGRTAENDRLRDILADLNVPPLEPVPADHVLTKSFFILDTFPGVYGSSPLWIEASVTAENRQDRPVRSGDGVSPIMITGNDLAGAWALDEAGNPLVPIASGDPLQRIYAFRAGVNILMYMLTGNYKADQVHIPALLERLGQ